MIKGINEFSMESVPDKLKAICIDDEPKAVKNLTQLVSAYVPHLKICASAHNVEEGVKLIDIHNPDIVFLDVEMNDETGFDLLEKVGEITFKTIFVTAHDEYALKAFKYSAFDYILKPIDIDELISTIDKISRQIPLFRTETENEKHENLKQNKSQLSQIVLATSEKAVIVKLDEIERFESAGNYTLAKLIDGREIIVSKNIKHFEDLLPEEAFCRIHRAHLINLSHLKEYHRGVGGEVEMASGKVLPVSRRKKKQLINSILH